MGKFIQPNGRQMSPIFPQMRNAQQRPGAPKPPTENKRGFGEEGQRGTPPPPMRPVSPQPPQRTMEAEATTAKKKMSVEDLRNGFKMSIIIGDPVSKKFRKK